MSQPDGVARQCQLPNDTFAPAWASIKLAEGIRERLLAGLHDDIEARLAIARKTLDHPVSKGDASEAIWLELFQNYLPKRYQAAKAHVVDSLGGFPWFR